MPATADNSGRSAGLRCWSLLARILDRLGDYAAASSAVVLLAMVALMGLEIAMRSLFHSSIYIAEEYSGYLFTWMTLACFLYVQRQGRYLKVVFLRNRLPVRARLVADSMTSLAAAVLSAVLTYSTWYTFSASLEFGSTSIQYSQTPLSIPQAIMPLGFALLTIGFLQSAVNILLQATGSLPIADEKANELDVGI